MDIISLLKEDHREVDALFGRLEAASERALKTKQKLFEQIKEALTVHAEAEEQIVYPRMRELAEARHLSFESLEEHRLVKQELAEIGEIAAGSDEWDAKVKVLIDLVRHHVKEEEGEAFKVLRAELEREELREMGERLQMFKSDFMSQRAAKRAKAPSQAESDGASAQLQA